MTDRARRRGRPTHRPALRASDIVAHALAIIDREGLDALTMRRLGAALDADPMAAYRYFPDRAALLDAVVDRVLSGIPRTTFPGPPDRPLAPLRRIAHKLRVVLLEHPHVVPLVATRPGTSPARLARGERAAAWLTTFGLEPVTAVQILNVTTGLVVSQVLAQIDPPDRLAEPVLEPQALPTLSAALAGHWDHDRQFDFALDLLEAGVVSRMPRLEPP